VNFSYPSRPDNPVLKDFSCVFEKGKTTALVGFSGSGKSTVIQLIERFYDPTSGSVELDGQEIKSLNLRSIR
jgi:ATP-binding cassette subfamily B (MDR/TAP) protein 1